MIMVDSFGNRRNEFSCKLLHFVCDARDVFVPFLLRDWLTALESCFAHVLLIASSQSGNQPSEVRPRQLTPRLGPKFGPKPPNTAWKNGAPVGPVRGSKPVKTGLCGTKKYARSLWRATFECGAFPAHTSSPASRLWDWTA
jgi:hypothetical protein